MRKLLAAASAAALMGLALPACAQAEAQRHHGGGMVFQSDANNDGVVTRAEFDAKRAEMFTRMDANTDGALERGEMRMGQHRRGGGHGSGLSRSDANNDGNITREEFLARPIAHFDRMDANDDNVISADERPQRRERAEGERRGPRGEGRARMDGDSDGRVTQAEFVAAGAAMFDRLDANKDGRVTREEAEAARAHRRGGDNN